jgi:hypothetical protein
MRVIARAYIGVVLVFVQVFFEIFSIKQWWKGVFAQKPPLSE